MKLKTGAAADTVDADVQVSDESPWSAALNLDNSGSKETGRTYVGAVLQNANMFGRPGDEPAIHHHRGEARACQCLRPGLPPAAVCAGRLPGLFHQLLDVDSGTVTAGTWTWPSAAAARSSARATTTTWRRWVITNLLVYGIDYKAYKSSLSRSMCNWATTSPCTLSLGYQGTWVRLDGDANIGPSLLHNIPGGSKGQQSDFDLARPCMG